MNFPTAVDLADRDLWVYREDTETCHWTCPQCGGAASLHSPGGELISRSLFIAGREKGGSVVMHRKPGSANSAMLSAYPCEACTPDAPSSEEQTRRRLAFDVADALGPGGPK